MHGASILLTKARHIMPNCFVERFLQPSGLTSFLDNLTNSLAYCFVTKKKHNGVHNRNLLWRSILVEAAGNRTRVRRAATFRVYRLSPPVKVSTVQPRKPQPQLPSTTLFTPKQLVPTA